MCRCLGRTLFLTIGRTLGRIKVGILPRDSGRGQAREDRIVGFAVGLRADRILPEYRRPGRIPVGYRYWGGIRPGIEKYRSLIVTSKLRTDFISPTWLPATCH